jgi:NAD(P)-dependent dehydrogenase (short-subunit alcohol dehydrogenase family)
VSPVELAGERAEPVAGEIDGRAVRTDVSREADITTLRATAQELGGPIELFFSNAGIGGPPGGPEADDAGLQMAWQVNVMAHVWAARALLPSMVQRGDGYLLSTASATTWRHRSSVTCGYRVFGGSAGATWPPKAVLHQVACAAARRS